MFHREIIYTKHFKERMHLRGVTEVDVFNTILNGSRMAGGNHRDSEIRTIFYDRKSRTIIVTAKSERIFITCFKADNDVAFNKKLKEYSSLSQGLVYDKSKKTGSSVWRDKFIGNTIKI